MQSAEHSTATTSRRGFSLRLYLFVVFALSWPFQIAYLVLGDAFRPLLLLSMIMAGLGTFVAGRYLFRDGFAGAGWHWGKPVHYAAAIGLALFLWLFPSLLEMAFGIRPAPDMPIISILATFALSFAITLLPAFGEEFSWRGYLLPRLMCRYSHRRALLLHGFVTWIWHLPVVVVLGAQMGGNAVLVLPVVMGVSLVPTVMHAVVFAYIWSRSQSLAVVTVYHSAFDEVRDTLDGSVGLGPLGQYWQMVVLTVLGIAILWKARWENVVSKPYSR